MTDGPRIGIIASGAAEFTTLHASCVDAGHLPVVYAVGRSLRSGGVNVPNAGEAAARIVDVTPPGIDLLFPGSMDGLATALGTYSLDLLVVFGFSWKLPPRVLTIPRLGAINVHVSMLPRYRGPAPMLWAIRNGDATGGVTVHWMDADFDTGNILAQQDGIPLIDDITWAAYCAEALPIIRRLLITSLALAADGYPGTAQDNSMASYAGFMEKEFSVVDWSRDAREIHNQVRTHRYMRSRTSPVAQVHGRRLRLVRTSTTPVRGIEVACGDGALWIVESEPATE